MGKGGRHKLDESLKKIQITTNTMFKPSELEDLGGKEQVKIRIKSAIKKEFYAERAYTEQDIIKAFNEGSHWKEKWCKSGEVSTPDVEKYVKYVNEEAH
jgi:hypothetical protein